MSDRSQQDVAKTKTKTKTHGEAGRRPYVAPAVSWEQPFETETNLASACAKIGGAGEPCDSAPSS